MQWNSARPSRRISYHWVPEACVDLTDVLPQLRKPEVWTEELKFKDR